MAYDDDGKIDWKDIESLAALLQQYIASQQVLTVAQLAELVNEVHRLSRGRGGAEVTMAEIGGGLREAGFANVPIGIIGHVVSATKEIPADAEAASHITLAQARRFVS